MNPSVGCILNSSNMNILCYADDIVLLAPTAQPLQVLLDSPSDHSKKKRSEEMPHCLPTQK